MKQHKWHKEIKAWADGAEIEVFLHGNKSWEGCINPKWYDNYEYRIKPQPKEPQYLYAWKNNMAEISFTENPPHPLKAFVNKSFTYIGKIKLEQDDDNSQYDE